MDQIRCLAPAKINLFLHVTGQRPDGYHELQTLFQFLSLFDELQFIRTSKGIRRIDHDEYGLPEHDLIVQAAEMLLANSSQVSQQGAEIHLKKKIPLGAGLGGGSSNAALTLLALNKLWELQFSQSQLLQMALELGADVPFFVFGKSAWASGVGEVLTKVEVAEQWYCLVIPESTVATQRVFQDPRLKRNHPKITMDDFKRGDCQNDLQDVTRLLYPDVAEALDQLSTFGKPQMNGSGGSVFIRCASEDEANGIHQAMKEKWHSVVVKSFNDHPWSDAESTRWSR